jgi:hypothetical protein
VLGFIDEEIGVMGVLGDTGDGIRFIINLLNQFLKPAHTFFSSTDFLPGPVASYWILQKLLGLY